MDSSAASAPLAAVPHAWAGALRACYLQWRRPVLFGVRMWLSAAIALFVAFWLQLDGPTWAATSAVIACQPHVGASLRRGWFRVVGTLIGAAMALLICAVFPQDRLGFLTCMALWAGVTCFVSTLLRNFASYAAALSGYTVAIIGGGALGSIGDARPETLFTLATARSSEIILGIACAGVVCIVTDRGDARDRLIRSLSSLSAEMMRHFGDMLLAAGKPRTDMEPTRREILRKVIALDPVIDQVFGESSRLRYHSPVLQRAVDGLFCSLAGWQAIDAHLAMLPPEMAQTHVALVRAALPDETQLRTKLSDPAVWAANAVPLRRDCAAATWSLAECTATSPSMRLIADKSAEFLSGLSYVLGGLALLVAPGRPEPVRGTKQLRISDTLPALINGVRAAAVVGAVSGAWVATGWSNGIGALSIGMAIVILMGPRAGAAQQASQYFAIATAITTVVTITITYAIIPALPIRFEVLAAIMAAYIIPMATLSQGARNPKVVAVASTMTMMFSPMLAPSNPVVFNGAGQLNATLAIAAGCMATIASFRLLPPLSSSIVAVRLVRLTRRDLGRVLVGRAWQDWSGRILGRLAAMPPQATPRQRLQLMVYLSVGQQVIDLREFAAVLGIHHMLEAAFSSLREGATALMVTRLELLDTELSSRPPTQTVLRARAGLLVIREALDSHPDCFARMQPK